MRKFEVIINTKQPIPAMLKKNYTLESFQILLKELETNYELVLHNLETLISSSDRALLKKTSFDTESVIKGALKRQLAILCSMTKEEKEHPDIIRLSRMHRIANGSGREISDVVKLLKQYEFMKKLMSRCKPKPGGKLLPPAGAARMPIPLPPVNTVAIGRKFAS